MLPLFAALALAQSEPTTRLVVGTHEVPPFVVHGDDGSWSGISIDLWKELAAREHLDYEIRDYPVDRLIGEHADPAIDVVVSLNISAARERELDLTHAFYSTGLAIAVRNETESGFVAIGRRLVSPTTLAVIAALAALFVMVGAIVWAVEKDDAPEEFGEHPARGIATGVLWALESAVGAGDPRPTVRGRVVGLLWVFASLLFVSGLTATIASELTVSRLEGSITGTDDLPRVRVGTVDPSAGRLWLVRHGLDYRGYPDATAALAGLDAGEVDAIVYEAPILEYGIAQHHADRLRVLPGQFDIHGYGFGLRPGSPIRESLNVALLEYTASDEWNLLLARYLSR